MSTVNGSAIRIATGQTSAFTRPIAAAAASAAPSPATSNRSMIAPSRRSAAAVRIQTAITRITARRPAKRFLGAIASAAMEPETMTYESDGRVARITLNRPDRGNGITLEMPRELAECVERANLDPDVHVIALAGNGNGFCGGYDLVASAERMGEGGLGAADVPEGSPSTPSPSPAITTLAGPGTR